MDPYDQKIEPRGSSEIHLTNFVNSMLRSGLGGAVPSTALFGFVDAAEPIDNQRGALQGHPPIKVLDASSYPQIEYAKTLIKAFQLHLNNLLFVIDEQELENLVNELYFQESPSRSSICQLCMIFALGEQILNHSNRALSIFWFENGRRYLDEILNDSGQGDLWTIRVYLMIALYYMSHKRNAAKTYLGTSLVHFMRMNKMAYRCNRARGEYCPQILEFNAR
jgi:hypothetical protein